MTAVYLADHAPVNASRRILGYDVNGKCFLLMFTESYEQVISGRVIYKNNNLNCDN